MSKDWFDNEDKIISYLNWKKVNELNKNMFNFIMFLFPNITENDFIKAYKEAWQNKSDLAVEVGWIKKHISIKKWSWNSVHQEPLEGFINYLRQNFSIDNELSNDIRFFIWWDWTLDWTWKKEDRLDTREIQNKYPDLINRIKNFFDGIKYDLIERFIILWDKSNIEPDAIYHWNIDEWYWNSSENILKEICLEKNISKWAIPVWALTFQAWNRAINWDKSEKKRWVIQLKFPWILNYLIK